MTIGFFVVEAAWIAFSALYPQAFDEQFHLGIIQVYSQHWLPFLKSQPPDANPYGAVARDPSFFFHYAMSFPYRFITLFFHSQTAQVIWLRLIDVALFTSGLILFHRVLRRAGLSNIATNISIFITTLIPVAPQLAGQINYDNLLMPLVACACLLTFNLIDQLQQRRFTFQLLLGLLTVCLLSSIVKYEFLPIFLAIVIFFVVFAWRRLHGHWGKTLRGGWQAWQEGRPTKWLLLAGCIAAFALFAQRDIGNVLIYHDVVPDCSQVLNIQDCSAYSVWIHDYDSHQNVLNQSAHADPDPLPYLAEWVYWLWYRLFFAINGLTSNFENYPPLPLPAAAFAVVLLAAVGAVSVRGKRTFAGRPYLAALGLIVAVYLLTLLGAGYQKYLQTDVLELMNGRYLFPILLPGAAIGITALAELTHNVPRRFVYTGAAVILLCFLDGGGVFTFIARSGPSWYWHNATILHMNDAARHILRPVLLDGPHAYHTGKWFFN